MIYSIQKNRLQLNGRNVAFRQTPHGGKPIKPRFLVLHYTAGRSFESTVEWFESNAAKASAHLVIGQNGEVCQMQGFDRSCWHTGASTWKGLSGLNAHSIGIEMDNAGQLYKNAKGEWRAWFGKTVAPRDVLVAKHRRGGAVHGWQIYTKIQIETCLAIATALQAHFRFEDILGHDDISWPRKTDPGPAFPLAMIRKLAMSKKS